MGWQYYEWWKSLFTLTIDGEKRWVSTDYQVAVDLDMSMKQRDQK